MAYQRRGWRYFATRLNGDGTETLLDIDLPLEGVTIEDVLSGDQALNASISPAIARMRPGGTPLLTEWGTAIFAELDGDIRFGGILVDSKFEGPNWAIECVGYTGYGRDMPYTSSGYKGIKVDPLDVVRVIWDHIQSRRGGDIALVLGDTDTNGKVSIGTELKQVEFDTQSGPVSFESGPYKLNWYTNHDLMGDVDNLAAETPFDYHERHQWKSDGTIGHYLDFGYPSLGRRRTDLRFVYGENVFQAPSVARSGDLYASGTMVLGAGEGAAMIKSISEPPARPSGRLRRIAIVVDNRIKSKTRADNRARAENQWRARLDDIESVIVQDHPHARLGAAKVGDTIRLEGKGDWIEIDMWVRILSISYNPSEGNIAQYTVARSDKLVS